MIAVSLAAFMGSYFSVFHEIRIDLFACFISSFIFLYFLSKTQALIAISIGFLFYGWTSVAIQQQIETRYDVHKKATVTLNLEITELPNIKTNSITFLAKPLKVLEKNVEFDFLKLKNIKLSWYRNDRRLKGGQTWQMTVKLQPPHGYQNEGGFDYEQWMFSENISATGYVLTKHQPRLIHDSGLTLLHARSFLSEKIQAAAGIFTYSALFQTLSIGDDSQLDPKLKQLFVETGTAHLLVISGLHVGLLSLLFYFLAVRFWTVVNRYFKTQLNQQDFAIIVASVFAFLYAGLAGFSLPTLRALIMLAVVYVAILKRHRLSLLNILGIALIIILFVQPLALLSYSFWLSFCAIFLIVISQYFFKNYSKFSSIILLQLFFSFLFIPLYAVVFNQLIISSFFANLVLIPVMSFVVIPLNFLASFFALLDWPLIENLYQFLNFVIDMLVRYLKGLNDVFGRSISLRKYDVWLMLISFIGATLFIFFIRSRYSIITFMLMVLPWFFGPEKLKKDEFNVVFFDVGMGTAVLVQTEHHQLLYDLGPGNDQTYQPAKWVILPYLQAKNISQLDKVIVSHSDQDHYGGIWPLLESNLEIAQTISGNHQTMNEILRNKINFMDCHRMDSWRWDGVDFKFLPIQSTYLKQDNNRSCVLKISSNKGSVLLTGDIERDREQELIELYYDYLNADVMLIPHHGSRTSSSLDFLTIVQPTYAVVTTGFLNRWGFPKKDVLDQYDALNIDWFNTSLEGTVSFNFNKDNLVVEKFRQKQNFLWY